jgi:hypothetical protein
MAGRGQEEEEAEPPVIPKTESSLSAAAMPKTTQKKQQQRSNTDESSALVSKSPQKTNGGLPSASPAKTPRDRRLTTAQSRRGSPKHDLPGAPFPEREIAKLRHRKFPSL